MPSDAQIMRLQRKATRFIRYADTCTKCIPEELGCDLADEMAESAIDNLAEALVYLTRVRTLFRLQRKAKHEKKGGPS